jgi:hypothetical protein
MREVKLKPYIVRQWSQLSYKYEDIAPAPDVWRLEFRLNGDNIKTLCDENSELYDLSLDALNCKSLLLRLFSALVNKFWRWAKPTASKFVDCKEVAMFDLEASCFIVRDRKDERAEVRKTKAFLRGLDEIMQQCNLGPITQTILRSQYHSQLPMASQELQKEGNSRSVVSWIKHWMQSQNVLELDPITYAYVDAQLKLHYTQAYERARMWAERNGIRNAGDDF